MRVILLKDVKGVGKRFEEREVSDGYALNFLIPKKHAVPATGAAAGQVRAMKEGAEKHREADMQKLESEVAKLSNKEVKVELKANEKNHLFAALTREKISEILKGQGIDIPAGNIGTESIKETGTFIIPITLGEKQTHFTLIVDAK